MHLLWNQDPQQAKKVTMTVVAPMIIRRMSALRKEYWGIRVAYPSCSTRNQIPTPRIPQPDSYNKGNIMYWYLYFRNIEYSEKRHYYLRKSVEKNGVPGGGWPGFRWGSGPWREYPIFVLEVFTIHGLKEGLTATQQKGSSNMNQTLKMAKETCILVSSEWECFC